MKKFLKMVMAIYIKHLKHICHFHINADYVAYMMNIMDVKVIWKLQAIVCHYVRKKNQLN